MINCSGKRLKFCADLPLTSGTRVPVWLQDLSNRRNGGYSLFYSCSAGSIISIIGKTFAHYRASRFVSAF